MRKDDASPLQGLRIAARRRPLR